MNVIKAIKCVFNGELSKAEAELLILTLRGCVSQEHWMHQLSARGTEIVRCVLVTPGWIAAIIFLAVMVLVYDLITSMPPPFLAGVAMGCAVCLQVGCVLIIKRVLSVITQFHCVSDFTGAVIWHKERIIKMVKPLVEMQGFLLVGQLNAAKQLVHQAVEVDESIKWGVKERR